MPSFSPPARYTRREECANALTHGIGALLALAGAVALIASTYTPITLVSLRGPWGWILFGLIWTLAAMGIAMEATRLRRFRAALIALYVIMGWAVVVAGRPMMQAISPGGLLLLLAGGLAYSGGIGFYLWRSLPHHHAIWRLFVMAGSALHYCAIFFYILPPTRP